MRSAYFKSGQLSSSQVRPGWVRSGQAKSGQVGSGQIRQGKVRLGQVRLGLDKAFALDLLSCLVIKYKAFSVANLLRVTESMIFNPMDKRYQGHFSIGLFNSFVNCIFHRKTLTSPLHRQKIGSTTI